MGRRRHLRERDVPLILFVTAKRYNTPPLDESDHYMCNTAIVRLEGKSPAGPFTFTEVVLPVFHHETHAICAPDDTLLIYTIKYDGGEFPGLLSDGCLQKDGCVPPAYNRSHEVMAVSWSSSVYGPWQEKSHFKSLAWARRQRILALSEPKSICHIRPKRHSYNRF